MVRPDWRKVPLCKVKGHVPDAPTRWVNDEGTKAHVRCARCGTWYVTPLTS